MAVLGGSGQVRKVAIRTDCEGITGGGCRTRGKSGLFWEKIHYPGPFAVAPSPTRGREQGTRNSERPCLCISHPEEVFHEGWPFGGGSCRITFSTSLVP